jgi:two-component system, NtrC family, sensor kinase
MDYRAFPVLYVDDENANRVVMKYNLGKEFTLLLADSADAALEILNGEFVAVLLADQRMPRVTGVELAEQTRLRWPEVVRVIITAYSDLDATIDAINRAHVNRFLKKPWSPEELVAVLKESINAFHNARLVKALQERVMQLDRISSIAIMSSAIAHDLRQPLGFVEPSLFMIREDAASLRSLEKALPPLAVQAIDRINENAADAILGVGKLRGLTDTLMKSIRSQDVARARLDLREVVKHATTLTRSTVRQVATLQIDLPERAVHLYASEGRLMQLTVNLLLNAAQSLDAAKHSKNRVEIRVRASNGQAVLEVSDTGCGVPTEAMGEIFKPLYSTKGATGSGLGLAICKQVVEELSGSIQVESRVGEGSRFQVRLPLAEPEP